MNLFWWLTVPARLLGLRLSLTTRTTMFIRQDISTYWYVCICEYVLTYISIPKYGCLRSVPHQDAGGYSAFDHA